ncbi:transposase [Methylobacterium sp. WL64]|nr:transposase [Methylobacterium sp. WL64]
MRRLDLTVAERVVIEPLLPISVRGKGRVDDRGEINGIVWRLRTGSARADLPARHGPHTICGNRFHRWRKSGAWHRRLSLAIPIHDRPYFFTVDVIEAAHAATLQAEVQRQDRQTRVFTR